MTRILVSWLIVLVTSLQSDAQQNNWTSLFDGRSLDGWTQKGGDANYAVEDGCIVGSTVPNTPNSFLCTERNYGNFILELEFQVHPELNSGIQIRSNSDPEYNNGRVHGYQVEIDPGERAWSAGIYDEGRRGWLFDLKQNNEARYAFRQGFWNHYRIEAIGDSIRTRINGVPAADLRDDMTDEGFIGLQVHGVGGREDPITVRWRNIRIQELPKDAVAAARIASPIAAKENLAGETARKLADGFRFTEGPALGPDGKVYFSDIPNSKIHVWDPQSGVADIYRSESGRANGLVWTANDGLIACEGGARRVTLTDADGEIKVLAEEFEGKKLNSPNDVTLDTEGGLYFTDPRYGNTDDLEQDVEAVYYVNRGRQITRVIDDLGKPNGIELSHDGKTLYVADTDAGKVFAWDVESPGKLVNKREFAPLGSDGMTIDQRGNLYLTNGMFVHVYSPDGEELEQLQFPEAPANVTFAGPDRNTLFVTARTGFYSMPMSVAGSRVFANPDLPTTAPVVATPAPVVSSQAQVVHQPVQAHTIIYRCPCCCRPCCYRCRRGWQR
ncbi:MAG: SMP-30/gluconolactonase/LRE family protein [Pirellulaceae bacterium]